MRRAFAHRTRSKAPWLRTSLLALVFATPSLGLANSFHWVGQVEQSAEGLASSDPKARYQAIQALLAYDVRWTKDKLLGALQDPAANVRIAAARGLAHHKVRDLIPALIPWLASQDDAAKLIAAELLGQLKAHEAVSPLIRSLGDPEASVRVAAIQALGEIGGEAIVVPLLMRLEDSKPDVRERAVRELKKTRDPRAVVPLAGLFRDPSLEVRIAAIDAMGHLGAASAVPALLRALAEGNEVVKLAAVSALGNLRAKEAITLLMQQRGNGDSALLGKVAYSLGQIAAAHPNHPPAQKALEELVESLEEPSHRDAAKEALLVAGDAAVPQLIAHLSGHLRGDTETVLFLLEKTQDVRATAALLAELERGRVPQKLVLQTIGALRDPKALAPLLSLLEDPSPRVRLLAMQHLEPLIEPGSEAIDIIADRLGDEDREVQLWAISYLGRLGSFAVVPKLIHLVETSSDHQMQSLALEALGRIGDPRAADTALGVLVRGPAHLRVLAGDVLAEVGTDKTAKTLIGIINKAHHSWRYVAVEALASVLRRSKKTRAEELLLELARSGATNDRLAAIYALGNLHDPRNTKLLQTIATQGSPEHRRAALSALGAMDIRNRSNTHRAVLQKAMNSDLDSVASTAALLLGQTSDVSSQGRLSIRAEGNKPATAVNASAALVLIARQASKSIKSEIFATLTYHRNPLVRTNAVMGLVASNHADKKRHLARLLEQDPSWLVRVSCLQGLSTLTGTASMIRRTLLEDYHPTVRKVAKELLKRPFVPPATSEWAVFRVVDAEQDDKPVRYQMRFVVGADGLARVGYSDARGRISYEQFPSGPFVEDAFLNLQQY